MIIFERFTGIFGSSMLRKLIHHILFTLFCQFLKPPEFLFSLETDWPQIKLQDDTVNQPIFTTTDKERTTTLKLDSKILHTNAIVRRENISISAKRKPIMMFGDFPIGFVYCATAQVVHFKDIIQQKRKGFLRIDDQEMAKALLYE